MAPNPTLDLLLADDQPVIRAVARGLLGSLGHRVVETADGEGAVALAGTRAFDAILMDIQMPGMGGVAAARAIRTGGGPSATAPILAVTAEAGEAERAAFAAAGIGAVLLKPVSREEWTAALAGLAPAPAAEVPLAEPDRLAALRRDLGAEAEGFWADFLREGAATVAMLADGAGDPARIAALRPRVHRLAGSAALFGAPRLRVRLGAIEAAIRDGHGAAPVAGLSALWAASVAALEG